MRCPAKWIFITILVFVTSIPADASPALSVNTEKVIVFKDGYCMFIKSVQGTTDSAGSAIIEKVPAAMVLGSFWLIPKEGQSATVTARQKVIPGRTAQDADKSLLLEFGSEAANTKVDQTLIYFGPGIRWIPTYRVGIGDNENADIVMQAEILNEAEDLSEVAVNLVVGVPNFRFKDVVSPLSLEARLTNPLQAAAPQLMSQSMSNVALMSQQRLGYVYDSGEEESRPSGAGVPAVPSELATGGSQDLFVYKIPSLSLDRGERAAIPLVSVKAPFRHIYTWDVRLTRSGAEAVSGGGKHSSPVKLSKNEVWHQIESENTSDVPWTTGAALVMDDYLPIAQELLTYTAIGDKNRLPLTVAVDIRGEYEEEEIGRDMRAGRFDGHEYVKLSKKGTLRVTNYKKESADLLIKCQFGGNATKASDEGEIKITDFSSGDWQNFRGSSALTGHSTIEWELTLEPGETKEVTCEYYYYLR
jgi:hypothetical protein